MTCHQSLGQLYQVSFFQMFLLCQSPATEDGRDDEDSSLHHGDTGTFPRCVTYDAEKDINQYLKEFA